MLFPTPNRRLPFLDEELRNAARCVGALLLVTTVGTIGFMLIERDWGLWKSLFFTLITITTVGYGDQGLSASGEGFAAIVLLLGIGTATYSFSSLVQFAINYQSSWKRRMQSQIIRLQDHFIISGYGRIGQTVAEQLQSAGLPFVVIDHSPAKVQMAMECGFLVVQGNSADDEVLIQAGIQQARGVICATNSDAENVFVTLSARELNPGLFIAARASTEAAAHKMKRAGATLVVSPYISAGHQITDAILRPKLTEFLLTNRGGDVELSELRIDRQSNFVGKTVREVGEQFPAVVFVAIKSLDDEESIRPGGARQFIGGDAVTIAGKHPELERIHNAADQLRTTPQKADQASNACADLCTTGADPVATG